MHYLFKRMLAIILTLGVLMTIPTIALANTSTNTTSTSRTSFGLYTPPNFVMPLWSTVLQDNNEIEEIKRDEDTTYRFMQLCNDVFAWSNTFTSRNRNAPISLRIESNVSVTERITEPPLINQRNYPNTPYGKHGTIASHGCGIACVTMVASYLSDTELSIVQMAKDWGHYNTEHGSLWELFEDCAEPLGIGFQETTYDTEKVMNALANGQVVICLQRRGLFTGGGHYIVLTGLTKNGRITVNDPNGKNWTKNKTLQAGFEKGFKPSQIWEDGGPYWIYEAKQLTVDTLNDERVTVTYQLKVNE